MTLYEHYTGSANSANWCNGNWSWQSFTVGESGENENFTITSSEIFAKKVGTPGTCYASIRAVDGEGKPSGSDLSTGSFNGNDFETTSTWENIPMSNYELSASTKYALIIKGSTGDENNRLDWMKDDTSPTYVSGSAGYTANSGSSWTIIPADQLFKIHGTAGAIHGISISEVSSLTDNLSVSAIHGISISEVSSLTDNLSVSLSEIHEISKTDTLILTDTINIEQIQVHGISLTDTLTLTDTTSTSLIEGASGAKDTNTFWINNNGIWVEFDHYDYFKIKKQQNQMSEFEVKIYDISTVQKAYFREQVEVLFFAGTTMILKGRIQTIEWASAYEVIARGYGIEAKLLDKEFIKAGDNRIQYTNESAQTIVTDINDSILTTHSSGIFETDYGNISMRFEYANRLNAIGKLAETLDYYWWVSQTSSDNYNTDYLHFDSNQGETSSQKTYDLTSNVIETSQERDITNLVNYVHALGYGDGVNQLSTSCYAASTQSSLLNANISATDTTITVVDGSVFNETGTARIADQQITYTGTTSTTLTGVARGVNSTTARAHNKNCYIEQHYTTDSAQTSSSIQTYGLMDKTLIDKTIIDRETLEVIASRYLLDRKTPIIRIRINPDEPLADASLNIGDTITITDSESNIDGTYRIITQEYESNYGFLKLTTEVSNKSLEFIEQMNKARQDAEAMGKYMQGSTNIYAISEAENCDENYDLDMRFYLPTESVAVNAVKLSFTLKDYRAYSVANASESAHTHNITIGTEPASGSLAAIGVAGSNLYSAFDTGSVVSGESGSAHTHGITYGITTSTLSSPSVVLSVGTDGGSMDVVGTYSSSTNVIDITNQVSNVGPGSWININFAPNKKMRIEANAYVQIFIESV